MPFTLMRVLEEGMYLLGPMNEPELRSAIEGPARRAGLRLEPGLVDLLVREVEGEPAALPLLSHVLRETWERREGPTLTVAGYRATGGIRQAVSQSAESLYDAMDAARRTQLRGLMLRLVTAADDGDPVRTRLPRDKIAADVAHSGLIEQLVAARLVTVDGDTLQIAHEALVRVWPRLRGWLDDDAEGQRLLRHLAGAADAWDAMGRPDSELYRGLRLSRTLEWCDRGTPDLTDTETAFLDASAALASVEKRAAEATAARERRSRRRLRGALTGVGLFVLVALVAGVLAIRAGDRAEQNRRDSEAAARLAEARRVEAQVAGQENMSTGLLLALEALTVDVSAQAWDTLSAQLTKAGSLESTRELDGLPVSMAASPDGALLAVSLAPDAPEPGVHLFDSATLEPVDFAETTPSSIIRFSPDGRHLAMAVNEWVPPGQPPRIDEQPIQLYDVARGALSPHQLGGMAPDSGVEYAMDYSDDGRRLVAVVQHYDSDAEDWTEHGTATVWDLAHPARPVFGLTVPQGAAVALDRNGSHLFIAMRGEHSVRAFDVDSGRLLVSADDLHLPANDLATLDVSPDGSTVALTSEERTLRLDSTTLRRRGPDLRNPDLADGAHYSHHGNLLATSSGDSVIVWDVTTGALLHRFAAPGGVWGSSIGWSADDHTLYAAGENLMSWRLGDVRGLLTLGEDTPAVEGTAYGLSLAAPDGRTLARAESGRLWFVDLATGRETPRSPIPDVWGPRWSPDGRWLLTTAGDERLRIWDTAKGRQVAVKQFLRGVELRATFSADGDRVYVVDRSGKLSTYDRATLRKVGAGVEVGTGVTTLGARGDVVLLLRVDGSFVRVRPETGEILGDAPPGTLTTPDDAPNDLSPDGRLLATSDADGRMRLLDVESLEWIGSDARTDTLADAGGWVAYAPDGSQFAALQLNGIGLWDGHTGAYQGSLPIPVLATGASIRYLPDASGLLLAARDGRTWTADTRTDTWAERACNIAGRNLTSTEWAKFFPSRPYHVTCPDWPASS